MVADECPDVDIYGTNMYRGKSFGDAFERVKKELNKPILFTEFGADAFNVNTNAEDQGMQAFFMIENWKEIYQNAAGLGKANNSIGGFTFQFSDGWWKYGQSKNLNIHDNNASWSSAGYHFDFKEGEENMNEEWFGICAKGPTDKPGLYKSYPRAAYYAIKKCHEFNPYKNGTTAESVVNHFNDIKLTDAVNQAKKNSKKGKPNVNLAEKLCEAGLVNVIAHRDEDDRSEYYDDLLMAEESAKKSRKGLHAGAQPTPRRFTDLTAQDPQRATARLPSLQRQGKMLAVVEFCYSGSRFKLFIPSADTFLNFTLSTVSCPTTAGRREGAVDEPFGQEATDFAKLTLLQRDVYIRIESANRGGTFMGSLIYDKNEQYELTLLREGLGYVSGYSATDQQYSIEAQAKSSKLGLWSVYKEEAEDDAATVSDQEFEEVVVSEIVEAGHFYTQAKGEKGLEWVAKQLAGLELDSKSPLSELPGKGELVCATWQGDWYRAKIMGRTKADDGTPLARIHFIDYGNSDLATLEQLRSMDAALSSMEPLAKECKLACLKCPDAEHDFGEDAAGCFRQLVWGKELVAKVEYREGKTQFVTLFESSGSAGLSVNSAMLREGLARVNTRQRDSRLSELVTKLLADEQVGKKERLHMWQWGDAGDDDDAAVDVGGMRRRT